MIDRLPRRLDRVEIRVLGSLLEKQQATPDYYPLTLNALVAACNQRSNRDPVLKLTAEEVKGALRRLASEQLVARDDGGRATRWSRQLDRRLRLDAAGRAVVTVLLLRGPQTAGETRPSAAGAGLDAELVLRRLERLEREVEEIKAKLTRRFEAAE